MIRLLASAVVALIANTIALVVANVVLEDMQLNLSGFIIAAALFTGVMVLATPLLRQVAMKQVPALLGSTALAATLVSLIVTVIVSDGLQIDGLTTWALATIIVWLVALGARLLLPLIIFKKALAAHREG